MKPRLLLWFQISLKAAGEMDFLKKHFFIVRGSKATVVKRLLPSKIDHCTCKMCVRSL